MLAVLKVWFLIHLPLGETLRFFDNK